MPAQDSIAPAAPLARRLDGVSSSAIRDLLAITQRPDIISLAGGLPDPSLMPADRISAAVVEALSERTTLQYTATVGTTPLRETIAARAGAHPDAVVVTHGSQQALSLLSQVLLDAPGEGGSDVVVEDPAYTGALQCFDLIGARLHRVPLTAEGLDTDTLEGMLAAGLRPTVVHTVSTFHNPGGVTLSPRRRRHLADLAERYGFWIIEDNPYADLWYDTPPPAALATYSDRVISLGSTSKILAPTLRVGWMIAPEPVRAAVELVKQSADLCGSTLTQTVAARLLADDRRLEEHLTGLRRVYGERARALSAALTERIPQLSTTRPDGGMFIWGTFVDGTMTSELLKRAVDEGVAFVPGAAFGPNHESSLRVCFATADPRTLVDGVERLARAVDASAVR